HARQIVNNVEHILGLEFLCAAQAIDLQLRKRQREQRLGKGTHAAHQLLRSAGIAVLTQDRVLYPDIRKAVQLLRGRSLIHAAREAAGEVSPCCRGCCTRRSWPTPPGPPSCRAQSESATTSWRRWPGVPRPGYAGSASGPGTVSPSCCPTAPSSSPACLPARG